jgi:hypothetical protein
VREKVHTTKHHRKPRSLGGQTTDRNISMLEQKKHEAWHTLFQNYQPHEIAYLINLHYLDPDFYFICVEKNK